MTNFLEGCLPNFISSSDQLKASNTKESGHTHFLDGFSPVLVRGSSSLKYWRGTHKLDGCTPFSSVVQIWSNTGQGLTNWMGVHHSCQWFRSGQTLERDSQTGWVFTVLVSGSDLVKHWRGTHILDGCSPFSSVVLIRSNTGEGLTSWMGDQSFSSAV